MNDPQGPAIDTGMLFLRILSPFYFVVSLKLVTDGILRGCGMMVRFMIATFSDLILRVGIAIVLSSTALGSTGIWMAWPVGWCIGTGLSLVFYFTAIRKVLAESPAEAEAEGKAAEARAEAEFAADSDPFAFCVGIFGCHADHCKDCRVVRIVEGIQLLVLTVNCQRVLGQIIGPYAEEIHFFCQLTTHHNGSRCLNHDSQFHILTERDLCLTKLFFDLFDDHLDLLHLFYRNDHREHNGDLSVSR